MGSELRVYTALAEDLIPAPTSGDPLFSVEYSSNVSRLYQNCTHMYITQTHTHLTHTHIIFKTMFKFIFGYRMSLKSASDILEPVSKK